MKVDLRRAKSRGFSLAEVLTAIIIIGILAGMSMLAMGRNSDSTEAVGIMSALDSGKSALLAYSMEHKNRRGDPIDTFIGVTGSGVVKASLDSYLDPAVKSGGKASALFDHLQVRRTGQVLEIGFISFGATPGIGRALGKKVHLSSDGYSLAGSGNTYSLWMRVR
jgi:prepilin-type N-terminal cleavage/methylation domain-containing protein